MRKLNAVLIGCISTPLLCLYAHSSVNAQMKAQATSELVSQTMDQQLEQKISVNLNKLDLSRAIQAIADAAKIKIIFREDIAEGANKTVTKTLSNVTVRNAIRQVLEGTGLELSRGTASVFIISRTTAPGPPGAKDSSAEKAASTTQVRGKVVDSTTGNALSDVLISLQPGNYVTTTNSLGFFILEGVPGGTHTVTAKIFGFRQAFRVIEVDARRVSTVVSFSLNPVAAALNEVVTTAIGSQRKVEIGNDIVKINATEILDRAPARTVTEMLRHAQVPGMQVVTASGDPGAPTRIRMRGYGSITSNTDPAIIVDGMWVNSSMSDSSIINRMAGGGYNQSGARYASSPLDDIDPSIIETIEIVRGPSAASLYGQEAANGVIVITTKRGKSGTTAWTYNFSRDWDRQVRAKYGAWIPYGTTHNGGVIDNCDIQRHYSLSCVQDSLVNLHKFGSFLDETGPAENYRHSLAVRGGVSGMTYNFSGSYQDQLGTRRTVPADLIRLRLLGIPVRQDIVRPSGEKRMYFSSSVAFTPNKNLSFDISANASNSHLRDNGLVTAGNTNGIKYGLDTLGILDHARASVNMFRGGSNNFSLKSALAARYNPNTWWNATAQVGIDRGEREDFNKKEFRNCNLGVCSPADTDGLQQSRSLTNVLTGRMSATGVVSSRFDRIMSVRPSVGVDVKRNIRKGVALNLRDVPFGADQFSGTGSGSISNNDVVTAGYYVNASVKLLERMYFDLGFRQDAGSVIQVNSSSRYPKIATSWLVSDEGFFPQNPLIGLLRLRGAIGYAAVHPEAADLYGGYRYSRAYINGQQAVIGELSTIGNNRLVPERSLEMEGGFDVDFLEDRFQLIFTVANKTLRNAIVVRDLPTSAGLSTGGRRENIARVDNRSIELSINGRIIDNDAMLLQFQTGISNVNNVIRKLGDRVLPMSNTSTDRLVEGYQVGAVWERPVLSYGDVDNNGYIDPTEVVLGDTTVYKGWNSPKLNASYGGSLSVLNRSLTLSFALSHVGSRVQRATYQDNYGASALDAPLEAQAFAVASRANNGSTMSVSEVRLMNMALNYNLPRSFSSRVNAKLITMSLQGSNLGLWTNYSGRDPMVNSTPVGNTISDNGFTLPVPRRYAFNIRLEL